MLPNPKAVNIKVQANWVKVKECTPMDPGNRAWVWRFVQNNNPDQERCGAMHGNNNKIILKYKANK